MKEADLLDRKIERYLRKGQLLKNREYVKLERPYLAKSRKKMCDRIVVITNAIVP